MRFGITSHKKDNRDQGKGSKAYPTSPPQEAPISSPDNPEARQNAQRSGNAEPTRDVSDEQPHTTPKKHWQPNNLPRKPLNSKASRHDNTEQDKNGPPLGYIPGELNHIYSYDTVANLGKKSRSPSTPEGENTKSRSWFNFNLSRQNHETAGPSLSKRSRRGNKDRSAVSSSESDPSNASVPNKSGLDASVDETSPSRGKELQRTETGHDEEDSSSRAVRKRISHRLHRFDREFSRSSSLEDIETAVNVLIEALHSSNKLAHNTEKALKFEREKCESLIKSRNEGARRERELEDKMSKLESDKEREKKISTDAATSALRDDYKKNLGEQESAWRKKEKEQHSSWRAKEKELQSVWGLKEENYKRQLHEHEEAAKQMKVLLEEHQSEWDEMKDQYDFQIQKLESERESWENTYRGNVAELDRQHQTRMIELQRDAEEAIKKIQTDAEERIKKNKTKCDNAVTELEDSIGQLRSGHEGELSQLELEHREHIARLQSGFRGEIERKEKAWSDRVSQTERKLETTTNSLNAEIGTMRERHKREIMEWGKEIAQIKANHNTEMAQTIHQYEAQQRKTREDHESQQRQMREDHESQQRRMTEEHNAIVAALGKQREEEQRSLWKRIESLKGALVKGDRFKAMSDRELARRFQDIASDVDAFARLRWDDGRVRTWPFPDKAFLNSENQRRDKQYLFQNTIWVILYEKIFCTPFRVLGKEGKSLEQQWMANFGRDRKSTGTLAHGPVPTKDSEKWRYETIQECLDATCQTLEEGDANYNVKRDYELSLKETTDDMLKELGRVSPVSDIDKQNFRNLVTRAAKFWLEVGQQRYRLFLVMSDSGGEPSRSGQIAVNKEFTQKLVVVPEVRRIGSGQGKGLENEELVADCKGNFNVFKFR